MDEKEYLRTHFIPKTESRMDGNRFATEFTLKYGRMAGPFEERMRGPLPLPSFTLNREVSLNELFTPM